MIILHTATNPNINVNIKLTGRLLSGVPPTTFRNNSYIQRLNRTLQAELRTITAYSGVIRTTPAKTIYDKSCESHQRNGRQLVKLIVQNRGIPDDHSPLSSGLTEKWVKICSYLSPSLRQKTTNLTLEQLEQHLLVNYNSLIAEAPLRDAELLMELNRIAQSNLNRLKK